MYDAAEARRGIGYKLTPTKPNRQGWSSTVSIHNKTASGAIIETAGRIGRPRGNKSLNPNAPVQFNSAAEMLSSMKGQGKQRGRVIYRAWDETKDIVIPKVVNAINTVATKFIRDTEIRKAA